MSDIEPAKCEKHKKDSPALTCSECLEDAIAEVRRLRELAGKAECYYCGHVSNRGVEVLAHIQECSVHPMNLVISFGRKIKELTAERDALKEKLADHDWCKMAHGSALGEEVTRRVEVEKENSLLKSRLEAQEKIISRMNGALEDAHGYFAAVEGSESENIIHDLKERACLCKIRAAEKPCQEKSR